jgi:hypothetical protein
VALDKATVPGAAIGLCVWLLDRESDGVGVELESCAKALVVPTLAARARPSNTLRVVAQLIARVAE